MEKRLLLAIVLSFIVLLVYQVVFVKKPPPQEPTARPPEKAEVIPEEKPPELPPEVPAVSEEEAVEAPRAPVSETREVPIVVETSLYRAEWTNRGGRLKSWKLKNYRDEDKQDLELISARSEEAGQYPFFLATGDENLDRILNEALYKPSQTQIQLGNGQSQELRFAYADDSGIRAEKVLVFHDGTYTFDVRVDVWKNGQKITPRLVWGPSFGNLTEQEMKKRIGGGSAGVAVYSGTKLYYHQERKYKPEKSRYNFAEWTAYDINYFSALFLASPEKIGAAFLQERIGDQMYFFLQMDMPESVYIGPKDIDRLSALGRGTKKLIRFGFFGWIAEILLRAIKAIHKAIPNWGVGIILLTLIIKILFFPLTYSSTKSMAKMQELQPKMKAIRAKYKKAKQDIAQRRKMNEEIMKLYKEHGINPAGGCLPILIQLPIFWGFFRMLVVSIEFRQSPFVFWIKDLSVKDPYYVTPILMGITQFISQKMTPTSADPTQQKMMLIMPVVMTVFFMNFQSGLVLYWLTNNVLQIAQQAIMNRLRQKQKRETHGKKRKK